MAVNYKENAENQQINSLRKALFQNGSASHRIFKPAYHCCGNSYYEKVGDAVACIDDELPFEIPERWEWCRFTTACTLISGRDLKPSEYNDNKSGIPYITGASNFNKGIISLVRWTSVPQVITEIGDLLITCKGTIGEIAINNFGKAHIARQVMAIRSDYLLIVDFLLICMGYYVESLKDTAKGLIPGISREDIFNLILPVPPIVEQHRIANTVQNYINIIEDIEKSLS